MHVLSRYLLVALLLTGFTLSWPALAQQASSETSRRFAPPFPPLQNTIPSNPGIRQTAPPLPTIGPLAPPMPPIVTFPLPTSLPLPTPCFFKPTGCKPPAQQLSYVSFGDSLAVGLSAVRGYVPRYEQLLEQNRSIPIQRRNFGRSGSTSGELARDVVHNTTMRQALLSADIVSWNVGGNDLLAARQLYYENRCGGADKQNCLRTTLTSFKQNWDRIVSVIQEAQAQKPQLILVSMDLYNPFVDEDSVVLQSYWKEANAHIAQSLVSAHIPFARVSQTFNGSDGTTDPVAAGYISFDGFHPNDRGHAAIAQELLRVTPHRVY